MFPSSEASYLKTKIYKRRKSEKLGLGSSNVPWASCMHLGHLENCTRCALGILNGKGADVAYLRISKVSIYVSSPQGLVRYPGLFDINYHFQLKE